MEAILLYLAGINIVTFVIFAIDKLKAKAGVWRVSEFALLMLTVIGGSVGALAAMVLCRHKIRNIKFKAGVPVILAVQVCIIVFTANL